MSFTDLVDAASEAGWLTADADDKSMAPATSLTVTVSAWQSISRMAQQHGFRFCAFWASEAAQGATVFQCLEFEGRYLLVRASLDAGEAVASVAVVFPAADRPERHAHDLLGIEFLDAPDVRRWVRHQAWREDEFPLARGPLPSGQVNTPPDSSYPFVTARGEGVVEVPVGPVHAGIIEPGHFRFQTVGETVLNLEAHLGYVHKGIEKLAVGRDLDGLARLAGRVSGDTTVAHTWAACQAIERASGLEVPARANWLRALMCERERIANHMGDIGAICNDVGYAFAQTQFTRLKEAFIRENHLIFGHRFMMDRIVPGGVAIDPHPDALAQMAFNARNLGREFQQLIDRIEASESLEDRLMTTGRLAPEQAEMLGSIGYVGKASGRAFDVRSSAPYAPYDRFGITSPVYRAGDVAARARVRADEVIYSLILVAELIEALPGGEVSVACEASGESEGIGMVEGWRGEIITYVALDDAGRISRFFPRDPSWLHWPALELLIQGNIVPDFPVCNKSINGSYSGQDL